MKRSRFSMQISKLSVPLFFLCFLMVPLRAVTKYVDSIATGSNNGTSWANAWTSLSSITASAGDLIYISGGPASGAQTYNLPAYWNPPSGSSASRITYQVGQDSAHNGTVIFNYTGSAPSGNPWLSGPTNAIVSGDAGDGNPHFKIAGYVLGCSNVSSVRLAYVDTTLCTALQSFIDTAGKGDLELDHCIITINSLTADHAISCLNIPGSGYDGSLFHHNTIRIPRIISGTGADGLQCTGTGISIYNNTVIGYLAAYTANQHQDGWQATGLTSYVKVYNNTWVNIGNYTVYGDAYFGGFTNVLVYNNLSILSDTGVAAGSPGAYIFGVDGGYIGTQPCTFTNVVIANNDVVDYHTNQSAISLNNITGFSAAFNQCYVANNLVVNSGIVDIRGNTTSTVSNNVTISAANAPVNFTTYSEFGGTNNNLHLKSTATTVIGQGINLSSNFTIDLDSNGRAPSGAWDVGAYPSGTAAPPSNALVGVVIGP